MAANTITSISKNTCTYHPGIEAVKVRINANRAVWRCAECLSEEEWARADLEAELAAERRYESPYDYGMGSYCECGGQMALDGSGCLCGGS